MKTLFTPRPGFALALVPALVAGATLLMPSMASSILAAPSSVAVVVGVNNYSKISGANLNGCINDAASMRDDLKSYGFDVTYLPDADKASIRNAIAKAAAQNPSRFVFYFAGHGTTLANGDGAILPSDTNFSSEYSLLSATELYNMVSAVPTSSRSIILDSCHSGAMMRAKSMLSPNTKARYYDYQRFAKNINKRPDQRPEEKPAGANDDEGLMVVPDGGNAPRVCYYVACDSNQVSLESNIDGVTHGYFTYYLTNYMKGQKSLWRDTNSNVTGRMTSLNQRPQLTSFFEPKVLFNLGDATAAASSPTDGWSLFNDAVEDPKKLSVNLVPSGGWAGGQEGVVRVNQETSFDATLGTDGYLIMLEQGTSGDLIVLWPESMNADDAYANAKTRIPEEGFNYQFDQSGFEEFRVMLFKKKSDAQAVLDALSEAFSDRSARKISPANKAKLRSTLTAKRTSRNAIKTAAASGFYSASVTVIVADPNSVASAPVSHPSRLAAAPKSRFARELARIVARQRAQGELS